MYLKFPLHLKPIDVIDIQVNISTGQDTQERMAQDLNRICDSEHIMLDGMTAGQIK